MRSVLEREDDLVVVGEASSERRPRRWCGRSGPSPRASAFDSRSAAAVVRSLSGRTGPRQQLTDREIEVLRLLAAGSPTRRSARLLTSATTVKFHVSNIMRKLEVSRRAEAVYAASKRGLDLA